MVEPITDYISYAPSVMYLVAVNLFIFLRGRCPFEMHAVGAVAGAAGIAWIEGFSGLVSWWPNLVGALLILFVVGLFAGRIMGGTTFFTLTVTVLMVPFQGWLSIFIGFALAAVVAFWRVARSLGKSRVLFLGMETTEAMGVTPAGFKRPEPKNVPSKETLKDVDSEDHQNLKIVFPFYLLAGIALYVSSLIVLG